MQFPHFRTGMKVALGIYVGARLVDVFRGGRWNGNQQEISTLVRTLPALGDICDRLMILVDEARTALAPTVTPARARRHARRIAGRRSGAGRRGAKYKTIIPTRVR